MNKGQKIALGVGVGAVVLGTTVFLVTKNVSAAGGGGGGGGTVTPKFKVGDLIWVGTHPATDVIYKIMAVHLDTALYDLAQYFPSTGTVGTTQLGFYISTIDAHYVLYTG